MIWLLLGVEDVHFSLIAEDHIRLQDVRPLAKGRLKGRQRIAGNVAGSNAPVCSHQHTFFLHSRGQGIDFAHRIPPPNGSPALFLILCEITQFCR